MSVGLGGLVGGCAVAVPVGSVDCVGNSVVCVGRVPIENKCHTIWFHYRPKKVNQSLNSPVGGGRVTGGVSVGSE